MRVEQEEVRMRGGGQRPFYYAGQEQGKEHQQGTRQTSIQEVRQHWPGRPAYRRSGNTDQADQHTGGQATLTRQTSKQEVRQHWRGRPAYRRSGNTDRQQCNGSRGRAGAWYGATAGQPTGGLAILIGSIVKIFRVSATVPNNNSF